MNKKIWIPMVYVVLTIGIAYLSSVVTFNIINGSQDHYDYTYQGVVKANTVAMWLSLVVTVYLFITLRHLFYKYPPLPVLYISQMVIVLLGSITYVTFTSIGESVSALMAFYGLSFVGSLISVIVVFALIIHPNTTTQMKYLMIPSLILGLIQNVVSTLVQIGIRLGLFEAIEQVMIIQGQANYIVFIIITLLTAGWIYLMVQEEEKQTF